MIDAVITWVDGDDPTHAEKRRAYMTGSIKSPASEVAAARWRDSDEISICVRSIELYAPWVRKIWIVTDNQEPQLSTASEEFKKRINIIDHSEIFQEYKSLLPVFNSPAIEALLFRIPGLSERFIYFNDDMFLMRSVTPSDFFTETGGLVLRGKLVTDAHKEFPNGLAPHREHQLNGARLVQKEGSHLFFPAHFTYSFRRSSSENLFNEFRDVFEKNIEFRFRDSTQFSMASLCANYAIVNDDYAINPRKDFFQVTAGVCNNGSIRQVNKSFRRLMKRNVKLGCINDADALNRRFPGIFGQFRDTFSDRLIKRFPARVSLGLKANYRNP